MHSVKIKDLGKVVTGKTPPSAHPEYFGGTVPFLTPTDMNYTRRTDTVRTISESGAKKFKNQLLPAGSTSFVCIGATIGKVTQNKLLTLTNQQINSLVPNDQTNPDYIYYALLFNKHKVAQIASGAATPIVNKTNFENVELLVHETQDQKKVALILAAYDDLIENNSKRIEKLESMAHLLYLKTVDGMTEKPVSEVVSFISRGISPKYDEQGDTVVINQRCIRDQKINLAVARRQSKNIPAAKLIREGDVLINSTGVGTLGRVAQVFGQYPNTTVDSHVSIVRPNEDIDPYYFGAAMLARQEDFERQGTGATGQTELSRDAIGRVDIQLADHQTQIVSGQKIKAIRALVNNLQLKNDALTKARDLLLPRLMSGEIEV